MLYSYVSSTVLQKSKFYTLYIYQPRHGTMKGTNIIYFGSKCFAGLGFLTYEWIKKNSLLSSSHI